MKYARHVDETTKITIKYYKKLLNNNHYQTITQKAFTTSIPYG